jgi:hypothetical protein
MFASVADDVVQARLLRDVLAQHVDRMPHQHGGIERRPPLLGRRRRV